MNLYDVPAREYGVQGRWPSPDPAGIAAVVPTDPQTWNRYAYLRNSPLNLLDPSGLESNGLDYYLAYYGDYYDWEGDFGWGTDLQLRRGPTTSTRRRDEPT